MLLIDTTRRKYDIVSVNIPCPSMVIDIINIHITQV